MAILAMGSYVLASLLTCRTPHNMDRLLHRGEYAVEPEATDEPVVHAPKLARSRFHIHNLVGIDEHFTRSDRWVSIGIFMWGIFWFLVFVTGSIWHLIHPWSNTAWVNFWFVKIIILPTIITVVTTIWLTIGCWNDLCMFFRRLREQRIDPNDNGTVAQPSEEKNTINAPAVIIAADTGEQIPPSSHL
jgi:hypothetical protein